MEKCYFILSDLNENLERIANIHSLIQSTWSKEPNYKLRLRL